MTPIEIAKTAIAALDGRKGREIRLLKTTELTTLADYFVICSGSSNTQINALLGAVEEKLKEAGEMPHHVEGHRDGTWVLADYSCVVVHIFSDEAREFYDLEHLWTDAEEIDISDLLTRD